MLARLLEIDCVADVAVDRSGTYLRLGVRERSTPECVETVFTWFEREGVFVERAGADILPDRWYGPDEVRELSRAEADELAAKVVAQIESRPDAVTTKRLRDLIAERLHDAFVTHHLERGERVPLNSTIALIRAEAASMLTVSQRDSLDHHLASTLDVPEAG